MIRYVWSDTLEPVLGEAAEAGEAFERLASMLEKLGAKGGAMSPVEMDGFVAGLLVLPETVPVPEWLPCVWGLRTTFDNGGEAAEMEAALIRHYNGVGQKLASEPEHYAPVLEVDEQTEEVFWQPWIAGFARAMRLRPGAWARIEANNELDVIEAVQVIPTLYAEANGTSRLAEEGQELLDSLAPMLIGGMVRDLTGRVKRQCAGAAAGRVQDATVETATRVIREALCGCGSGREYARCCGAH